MDNKGEIVIYQTQDGTTQLDVRLDGETVWITQEQMAQLFQRDRTAIGRHIANIFSEEELDRNVVCANFAHTTLHGAIEGKTQTRDLTCYNLDVIISVGYRVKSQRGVQFRQWASRELSSYVCQNNVLTGSTRVLPLFDPQTLHWFVYRVGVGNFGYKLAA